VRDERDATINGMQEIERMKEIMECIALDA
jgi:hypothetical protein